jgi:hypothetical protein
MVTELQLDQLPALCRRTLQASWREGTLHRMSALTPEDAGGQEGIRFAYTCPSPSHYPWQWYWDSCFTAIVWRRFDPDRSRRELETLLAAQREDGFIGHTIFWNTPLTGLRRHTYNVLSRQDSMTSSIQPPLLAWAWRIAVGDPAQVPAIAAHHDWLERNRTLDEDGLLWLVQPDESGLDASPQFDPVWRRRAHALPGFLLLVRRNRRLGYDLRRIAAAGGPVVCEVMTNVLYSLSRMALGRSSLTQTIIERFYDERAGVFTLRARPGLHEPPPLTWAALSPLALPDLPEEIGRRLVEEHLLNPRRFWLAVAPPSVSAEEPEFCSSEGRIRLLPQRYWRGPTWMNSAWLLWLGLRRLGYEQAAQELAAGLVSTVLRSGLREYYHPRTGAGMGALDFGWSSLVLELFDPDPRAERSYL